MNRIVITVENGIPTVGSNCQSLVTVIDYDNIKHYGGECGIETYEIEPSSLVELEESVAEAREEAQNYMDSIERA